MLCYRNHESATKPTDGWTDEGTDWWTCHIGIIQCQALSTSVEHSIAAIRNLARVISMKVFTLCGRVATIALLSNGESHSNVRNMPHDNKSECGDNRSFCPTIQLVNRLGLQTGYVNNQLRNMAATK